MSTPEEHRSPLVFSAPQSVSPYLSAAASSPFSAVHYAAPRSASVGGGPRLHAQKASDDSMRSHRAASAMPALQAAPGSAASHPKWVISRASVSPTPPLVRTSIDAVSDRAGSEDVARNRSDESLRGGIDGSETSGKKESLVSLALRSVASLYTIPGSFIVATGFLCIFIQKTVEDETMKDNLEKVTALFTSPRH